MEVVVGMVIAWVVAKARRAANRGDGVVDSAIDAAVDRVGELVQAKLGGDPAVRRLELEAAESGEVTERSRTRVALALEDAAEDDEVFARRLAEAVAEARQVSGGPTSTVWQSISGTVTGTAIQIGGDHTGDIRL
ncbi:hypothetical protein UO65_2695 [Actinokineospora spheciospongiae]|uniref:Chromosome partitioning protein n=1 Tax=Actinokineospora spheciospongiae TaxID=909613 RepID=W7J7E6_9PSEU|nr:hypothetical protein [Actinokineospora spheciospongiae]EWC61984.1 hypothetical protein UO65_2695 [Actinokineospora spheciospongiae]PWW63520.1 hypothetical protein DFQ13_104512 [Actinokineospora spheciospongiae]